MSDLQPGMFVTHPEHGNGLVIFECGMLMIVFGADYGLCTVMTAEGFAEWTPLELDEVRAKAWDRGYTSGHSRAMRRMSDEPKVEPGTNPYRTEARGE